MDYPSTLVLIVCRVLLGEPDINSEFTGWRDTQWDMADSVMHCKRVELELYDPAVDQGADPMPFTPIACMRAAMTLGPGFDVSHRDKPWRFFRAACPTPIMDDNGTPDNTRDDRVIGWSIPGCPQKWGTIVCEQDTAI